MADSSREVAATIAELIHRKRPDAAFLTYIQDHTDGIMSESNTAVGRALPLWPYSASDNVSRSLGSEPDKLAINLAMSFVDFPWRYAHVPQPETALRLYQNIAHGAPPAVVVSGPMEQQDRSGLLAAKPIFDWHARHEDLYVGQKNAARVLLLATGDTASYRGFFRVLTEEHIPFVVSENLRWMEDGSRFDLVIAPERPDRSSSATCVTAAGCWWRARRRRRFRSARIAGRKSTQGYWRIHDRTRPAVAEEHRPALHRRRVSGDRAARASDPHPDPDRDVRPARESVERQGRDDGAWPGVREPWQGSGRLHPVGRRRPLLPAQLRTAPRPDRRRHRSAAARRAPADDRRASAGRDDGDGSAGPRPHADPSGQRNRATTIRRTFRRSRSATSASISPATSRAPGPSLSIGRCRSP